MLELHSHVEIPVTTPVAMRIVEETVGGVRKRRALIGEVVDPIRLIYATRDTEVDAIIVTPMNTNGIPRICSHLLAEHPNLKIIVLLAEGKTAFLYESASGKKYINEPSADTIVNTIRQSLEKIRNKQPQVN